MKSAEVFPSGVWLGGVLLLLCLSSSASGRKMSAGVVVGRSLTHGFRDLTDYTFMPPLELGVPSQLVGVRFWSPSRDWLFGGMLQVRLNQHWYLEVNALFRQINGSSATFQPPEAPPTKADPTTHVVTWQFPVLAKYRFYGRRTSPFVAIGPSFRTEGNLNADKLSHHGIAAGAGFEMNWRRVKIAPTIRYTLWAADKRPGGHQTASDQVELLVGFSKASEEDWRPLGRHVSLGFTLGVNVSHDYPTSRSLHELPAYPDASYVHITSGARNLIYGPTVEVRLPHRFSVEVGALHRPIALTQEVVYAGRTVRSTSASVTWVFPVLAKYRLPVRGPTPFVALGPSFRKRQSFSINSSRYGLTAAVGLEWRVGPVRIGPALRYTHWAAAWTGIEGPRRNQPEALVGFSF
ncbi:MAG TPA: hypothetical protein VNJ11_14835 [Bryobacteraceae bacterium]|nr:hypothetical protein [Bryobacteraceae bacterium]